MLGEIFARAGPRPKMRSSRSLNLSQSDTAGTQLGAVGTASKPSPRYIYLDGFGLARAERVLSEIFAKSRLGGGASVDPAEIPQACGAETQPSGACTTSTQGSRVIYYGKLGLALLKRVSGEIFAKVGTDVRAATRPRFLKPAGPKRSREARARYHHEA